MAGMPRTRQSHVILADLETDPDWWPKVLDRLVAGEPLFRILADWCITWGAARDWINDPDHPQRAKDIADAEAQFAAGMMYDTVAISDGVKPVRRPDGSEYFPDVKRDGLRARVRTNLAAALDPRWGAKDPNAGTGGGVTVVIQKFAGDTVTLEAGGQTLTLPSESAAPSMRVIDVSRDQDADPPPRALGPAVESPRGPVVEAPI